MARVFMLGASGTIGQATVRALLRRGHEVVCLVRPRAGVGGRLDLTDLSRLLPGAELRVGQAGDLASQAQAGWRGERFDALVSCLASRTGMPRDAWAVDHDAHLHALTCARQAGVQQVVQLSALCLQKPLLPFQQAKLAFERALMASGLRWSIVRPTSFFKSLCGQVERVRRGQPFLLFGDGRLTACKPISDDDLADYLADCLHDPDRADRILPIGGPGPALTLRDQGELLFRALGRAPRFREVPVGLMSAIVGTLGVLGKVWPAAADKAELARIGRYYATESMLVLDPLTRRPNERLTPSAGRQTLGDFYAALARGEAALPDRGDHAVF
ncbi:NAD(P)H-binding protein [Roseateles amylovorans]|uniref:Divinyl chlorophyllide a 8-vinyl-reductase, chloroplastic n=1 Tax=Roseateles amylovorans TaxID=2978473 RepID=A0ABY6B0K0_9BURK|nr:NAD(P)H-binding protein [Roseateles amylovorans]UXH78580.1 NAD(P)H-binding protein [Roseateles amylovorans]